MYRGSLWAMLLLVSSSIAAEPSFRAEVAPVLANRCVSCHQGPKAKGGYKLSTWAELVTPGKSGEAILTSGKPEASELLSRLTETDPNRRMPPDDEPLSATELGAIRQWIAAGAKFDGPSAEASIKSYLPPRVHPPAPASYAAAVPVFAIAFAPDGKEIAVGGVNEVTIWDAATGKLLRRLPGLPARIHALAYSPDGQQLLVGGGTPGEYGEVTKVDLKTPGVRKVLGVFEDIVLAVAFSPDGQSAVAGGAERSVRFYHGSAGTELWRASFHSDWVTAVAIDPTHRFVASASKDRTVKVLDAASGKLFTTYNGHRRQFGAHTGQFEVYGVAFDSKSLAYSAGAGDAVRIWEPIKAQEENGSAIDMEARFAKAGHTKYLEYTATRPVFALTLREGQVFTAAGDGKVRQHDPATSKLVREYTGASDWLFTVTADSTGRRVAAAGFDGTVWLWDTTTGNVLTHFRAAPGASR